jgi:hypothetical protein
MSTAAAEHTSSRPQRALRHRRPIAVIGALLVAVALAACGGSSELKETSGTYDGSGGVGAPYLSVGPLVYNVQISRALNPYDIEDSSYLAGLSASQRELHPGQEFFGVFMQVLNETGKPHVAAGDITVSDIEGHTYHPIEPDHTNLYAYRPEMVVPAKEQLPILSSTAASAPINGLMLLYKLNVESLEYRPLTVKIVSPTNPSEVATAELDS